MSLNSTVYLFDEMCFLSGGNQVSRGSHLCVPVRESRRFTFPFFSVTEQIQLFTVTIHSVLCADVLWGYQLGVNS